MKQRILAWLLVLAMVFSFIPSTLVTPALAADVPAVRAAGEGVTLPGSYTHEYDVTNENSDIEINAEGVYKLSGISKSI